MDDRFKVEMRRINTAEEDLAYFAEHRVIVPKALIHDTGLMARMEEYVRGRARVSSNADVEWMVAARNNGLATVNPRTPESLVRAQCVVGVVRVFV